MSKAVATAPSWWSSRQATLPMEAARFQSLVRELRAHATWRGPQKIFKGQRAQDHTTRNKKQTGSLPTLSCSKVDVFGYHQQKQKQFLIGFGALTSHPFWRLLHGYPEPSLSIFNWLGCCNW